MGAGRAAVVAMSVLAGVIVIVRVIVLVGAHAVVRAAGADGRLGRRRIFATRERSGREYAECTHHDNELANRHV